MDHAEITERIIAAAIKVHRALGPGLLESTYKRCLVYELGKTGLRFGVEVEVPVYYDGVRLECGYRVDSIVEDLVILEIKSVAEILPIHVAQTLTYMRLGPWPVGLLINFNVAVLTQGIRRLQLKPPLR